MMLIRISALLVLSLTVASSRAEAGAWTVGSTTDQVDATPGDGFCRTAALTCTLRAAITESNLSTGSDTISVPAGTYTLTLVGGDDGNNSGDLDIIQNSGITITGTGSVTITRSAGVSDRIFHLVYDSSYLVLRDLTVSGGTATQGGNIYNKGLLHLRNVTVQNGVATSGGGIYNHAEGTMTVMASSNATFLGNQATDGGAIYNFGHVWMSSTATASFTSNTATSEGGAIFSNGDTPSSDGTVSLSNATFTGNVAESGGAIFGYGYKCDMNVYDSSFSGNSATNGGAIWNGWDSTLDVLDTTFVENSADLGGAAFLGAGSTHVQRSTFQQNDADSGSAIYTNGGDQEFRANTFAANTAAEGCTLDLHGEGSTVTLITSTVSGNTGTGVCDDTLSFTAFSSTITNNATEYGGGGIHSSSQGAGTTLVNTIVAENTSVYGGADCDAALGAPAFVTNGYNLIGYIDGCPLTPVGADQWGGSLFGGLLDPRLAPLASNGGPTQTHKLLSTSSAIDAGDPSGCEDSVAPLWFDQRHVGFARHKDGDVNGSAYCDIGAFEY
jgi:predicted outer membrane repeat protein